MKLQNLTVIFVIIVIPVILLMSMYMSTGLKTLIYQSLYDNGLLNATHDAIYAFEQNTANDEYHANPEIKRDIIKASIKMFEKSLSNTCNISLYSAEEIEEYIPAILFGMYDGFYMYAPSSLYNQKTERYEYKHNLKNYVYYSEELDNDGTIIRYSLDNYVVVSGNFDNKYQLKSGYLINLGDYDKSTDMYKGDIKIEEEMISGEGNSDAINYFEEAYEFSLWFKNNVSNKANYLKIDSSNDPENPNSAFSIHKREVIKNKIEGVLNSSITSYSNMIRGNVYKMPKLSEEDWEKIHNNISMITFFQGKKIGLTKYNGYCVLNSTNNKEYVNKNLIYFTDGKGDYHDIRCSKCKEATQLNGYKIGSFEKKKVENTDLNGNVIYDSNGNAEQKYIYEHQDLACYKCINGQLSTSMSVSEYIDDEATPTIKKAYYTSLARERYNTVKLLDREIIMPTTIPMPNAEFYNEDGREFNLDKKDFEVLVDSPQKGGETLEGKNSFVISATFSIANLPSELGHEQMIVCAMEGSGWALKINAANELRLSVYDKTIKKYVETVITKIGETNINKKYTVTAMYDGENMIIYCLHEGKTKEVEEKVGKIELNQRNDVPTLIGANPYKSDAEGNYKINDNGHLRGKVYSAKLWYNKVFDMQQLEEITKSNK